MNELLMLLFGWLVCACFWPFVDYVSWRFERLKK